MCLCDATPANNNNNNNNKNNNNKNKNKNNNNNNDNNNNKNNNNNNNNNRCMCGTSYLGLLSSSLRGMRGPSIRYIPTACACLQCIGHASSG